MAAAKLKCDLVMSGRLLVVVKGLVAARAALDLIPEWHQTESDELAMMINKAIDALNDCLKVKNVSR